MYSSEDLERFYFLYQTEALPHGEAIQNFCLRNKVPYNIFSKWYKDTRKNIAFMFGLLESCKLNNVNFGEYIEDVLTRILLGEQVDESFLPCDYVRRYEDGRDAA